MFGSLAVMKMKLFNICRWESELDEEGNTAMGFRLAIKLEKFKFEINFDTKFFKFESKLFDLFEKNDSSIKF